MKKIIMLILVGILVIASCSATFAETGSNLESKFVNKGPITIITENNQPDASIQQYSACPSGNGIHKMKRRGCGDICVGEFGNATCVLRDGCCWQCTKCYEVIITENDPLNGLNIGIYATAASTYQVSPYNTIIYVKKHKVCNASHLDGFSFSYS